MLNMNSVRALEYLAEEEERKDQQLFMLYNITV